VLFLNNTTNGAGFILGNTIGGNLVCQDNTPPPTNGGFPNTVGGNEIGQCKGL
jgi:hexosaminidase